jgi:hypothetical protein
MPPEMITQGSLWASTVVVALAEAAMTRNSRILAIRGKPWVTNLVSFYKFR